MIVAVGFLSFLLIPSEPFPEPGAAQRTNQGQGGKKNWIIIIICFEKQHSIWSKIKIKKIKYLFFSPEDVFLKLNPRYAAVDQLIGLLNGDEGSGDEDGAVAVEENNGQEYEEEDEEEDEEEEDEDDEDEEEDDDEEDDHIEDDLETKGLAQKERNVQDGHYTEEDDEDKEHEEKEEEDENEWVQKNFEKWLCKSIL